MGGAGVRHPTLPIQRIVSYFNFNFNVKVLEKKLNTWHLVFEKGFIQTTHTHTHEYLFAYNISCEYLLQRVFTIKTCEIYVHSM